MTDAERWEWVARYLAATFLNSMRGTHTDPAAFANKLEDWPEGERVLTSLRPVAHRHMRR